jgi:hypothetical protein
MERPGPSSPEILSPEKFSPVSGKVLDGRDGLLGCLSRSIQREFVRKEWIWLDECKKVTDATGQPGGVEPQKLRGYAKFLKE